MPEPTYLTREGAAKLEAEVRELKGPRREELSKRLRAAIQMGDLSENADYHKAKEDQGFLEGRIQEIEHVLRNAVIIEKAASKDIITVGSHVTSRKRALSRKPITSWEQRKQIRAMAKSRTNHPSAAQAWTIKLGM
jgi:transcription elongation GreA/GreB family factor